MTVPYFAATLYWFLHSYKTVEVNGKKHYISIVKVDSSNNYMGGFYVQVILIVSMVFSIIVALFAVQNAAVVDINFLWYKVSLSQAVVILGSALIGVLIMVPFDAARTIKNKLKMMELSNENKRLKEELKKLNEPKAPVMPEKPETAEEEKVQVNSNQ